jgi:hypothetical protein
MNEQACEKRKFSNQIKIESITLELWIDSEKLSQYIGWLFYRWWQIVKNLQAPVILVK